MIHDIIGQCAAPVLNLDGGMDLLKRGATLEQSLASLGNDSPPMPETVWRPWMVPQRVVSMDLSCRPCNPQVCGDAMVTECLAGMEPGPIVRAARELIHMS